MRWALTQADPDSRYIQNLQQQSNLLIQINDYDFKPILDNYKYPQRLENKIQSIIVSRKNHTYKPSSTISRGIFHQAFLLSKVSELEQAAREPLLLFFNLQFILLGTGQSHKHFFTKMKCLVIPSADSYRANREIGIMGKLVGD